MTASADLWLLTPFLPRDKQICLFIVGGKGLGGETKRTFTESDAAGQLEPRTQNAAKDHALFHKGGST